ncbi:hypothetical protein HDU76_008721 [Blyttiomyces sp. JEL0837]|nr:hypothetical protein HDU76_008721 [Blyttiomyces sp. JEL0837]
MTNLDSTTLPSLRLHDKFTTLTTSFQSTHTKLLQKLISIQNLLQQRSDTLSLYHDKLFPLDLVDQDTSGAVDEFVSRLVYKQTLAVERLMGDVMKGVMRGGGLEAMGVSGNSGGDGSLDKQMGFMTINESPQHQQQQQKSPIKPGSGSMSTKSQSQQGDFIDMISTVRSLQALRRDIIQKATISLKDYTSRKRTLEGHHLTNEDSCNLPFIIEVSGWIDGLVLGYERELNACRMMLDGLTCGKLEYVEKVIERWRRLSCLDLGWEREVDERIQAVKKVVQRAMGSDWQK